MAFDTGTVQPHGKRAATALKSRATQRAHRGYALITLVAVIGMLAIAWLVTSFGATAVRIEREWWSAFPCRHNLLYCFNWLTSSI